MRQFPTGGLIGKIQRLIGKFSALQIGVHASSASFFLALSVFPALLLLLGLLRYTPLSLSSLMAGVEGFLPEALLPYAEDLIRDIYEGSSGAFVSVSAVTALWSASRGIHGLLTGLNAVYGIPDARGYVRTRLLSAVYTVGFLAVLALTLLLHVFGTAILDALRSQAHPFVRFLAGLVDLRFFLLLFLQTALFAGLFHLISARQDSSVKDLPGALLASVGWLTLTNLYSFYVDNFGDYTHIYGSVYTVALSMLWLYLCICIVFFGGALNRFLADYKQQ